MKRFRLSILLLDPSFLKVDKKEFRYKERSTILMNDNASIHVFQIPEN